MVLVLILKSGIGLVPIYRGFNTPVSTIAANKTHIIFIGKNISIKIYIIKSITMQFKKNDL